MNKKPDEKDVLTGVGAMAEMAYLFHQTMIEHGADNATAHLGMYTFIFSTQIAVAMNNKPDDV